MPLPAIVPQQIIAYCGRKMYENAHEYRKTQALYVRYRDKMTIKAICEDTESPCYFVSVRFDALKILGSTCTCNDTLNGPCKHIAALLLAWHNEPRSFVDKDELGNQLHRSLKKDLIALIQKMAHLYPDKNGHIDIAFC